MTTTTKAARFTKGQSRYYNVDGVMLPSVTSILACLSKPVLVNWAGKVNREAMCAEAADFYAALPGPLERDKFRAELWKRVEKRVFHNEQSKAAADLGTLAHARCEWIISGMLGREIGKDPDLIARDAASGPTGDIDRALWASLSFLDWIRENNVEPIDTEVVVAHRGHGFAGTADLIAKVHGVVSVIDLKTSSGIYPEMYMQLAAYRIAMVDDPALPSPEDAYVLRLPKKETDPDFEAVKVDRLDAHLAGFLALRDVFLWQKECA